MTPKLCPADEAGEPPETGAASNAASPPVPGSTASPVIARDAVDDAGMESFPASDPPGWWSG